MSQRFPSGTARWIAVGFVAAAAIGFGWALVRPHAESAYRIDLDEQRARFTQRT